MDTKKLDKWADLLLDTGKRNNLINFKDTRASTIEVLFPTPAFLFEKANGSKSFEVYDPTIDEEDEDDKTSSNLKQLEDKSNAANQKTAYKARHSGKINRQNQILLYSREKNPLTVVKNIDKKSRQFIEETGVNVAYMVFGFIHWKESNSSNSVFNAPVLLIPIQLEQASGIDPYYIKFLDDDIIVNPTFSYKMNAEYGIKLPEYNDEGLTAYLRKIERLVKKLQWTVTSECKIGLFSFLKINMYRDLKDNAEVILANRNVRQLLGEPLDTEKTEVEDDSAFSVSDPLIELHSVVDADSSQIEAIEMAKSGKSFVLQGPPGTGKSQTITNIIAECLSDGKKVLFVSEKLAALNVVYEKLKQAGLAEFCLQLHSHKANKKDVIKEICDTLRTEKSMVSSKAAAEIAAKKKAQHQLDAYAFELHKQRPVIEKSLYQLYDSFSSLRAMPDVEYTVPALSSKGEAYLTDAIPILEQYVDYIPSIGYDYRNNPWYGYINQDVSYQSKAAVKSSFSIVKKFLQRLVPIQQEINEKYDLDCYSIEDTHIWNNFFAFAATSTLITPALLDRRHFDMLKSALPELQRLSREILAIRSELDAVFDEGIYQLNGAEYHKKLTVQFDRIFSRIFNSEYRQLISNLRFCKRDGKRLSYKEAVALTEKLSYFQQKTAEFVKTEAPIIAFTGEVYKGVDTDWDYITEQMPALEAIISHSIIQEKFGHYDDFSSERAVFKSYHQKLEMAFLACRDEVIEQVGNYFDKAILDINYTPSNLILIKLTRCLEEIDKLENWCYFRNLLSELTDKQLLGYIHAAIAANIESEKIVGAYEKLFYCQWIYSILSENEDLATFNRISQDKAIQTFSEKDTEQFEINKAKIRAELSSMRPSLDMIASGSALAVLLREGEKKRKQKSIRTLLKETGDLVQRLKPCFLMSPLSVSTFLAPESVNFDVVIFDEASQIFPQDAIGAIYRGKQLIVVGDSRQMPPSNFFNASIEAVNDDEDDLDITDFESILDLCSTSMQQLRLRWHYRSRYEQLIAFSNRNFYDNDLVTFPSSKADTWGTGVDYYHVDGLFDRKSHTNRKEAEFIVDLIYENIEKFPNRSLGVVAFSVAQQELIDKLLSSRRQNTPEKEFFFKNDRDEPFFIKNLETVQGDERDTIIFSVAYGIDSQGRLLHNFGPLNRMGGERRLNVAVTRAKHNVQLVSSMHYTDIDLNRSSAEGVRVLREYLDFAENGEIALDRMTSVSPYEQFDSDFELEVCDYLRSRGFSVDTQVGCSGFRIDLGLKRPNSSDYVLAIECDGATYHSSRNARDRDRLRQEVLERMGWKFYRIWSTDWFRNKSVEQLRLVEAAAKAIKSPVEEPQKKEHKKTENNPVTETFEEVVAKDHFEFPTYKAADIDKLKTQYLPTGDFLGMIKAILEIEAPLSEELLLKRLIWYFGRKKVTSAVQRNFNEKMHGYEKYGIIRRNGFLYLDNGKDVKFRVPGDINREIKHIAPEELAAGLLDILKQNVTVDKSSLYRSLATQCGLSRAGSAVSEKLDIGLDMLKDQIVIEGNLISIK